MYERVMNTVDSIVRWLCYMAITFSIVIAARVYYVEAVAEGYRVVPQPRPHAHTRIDET